jgi:hypothetical protein
MLRRVPVTLGAVLVIGSGVLAGCGGDGTSAAAPASSEPSAGQTSASTSPHPEQSQTPKVKTPKPKDRLAPSRIKPVIRNGKVPHPTESAAPATMKGVVHYSDGVKLDITGIKQGHVTGSGPGVVKGPTTTFSLTLTNDGRHALKLNSVVVTAVYGRPGRIAHPIYLDRSRDFAGTAKPGKTSTAVYTFSIPVSQLPHVTIHVDFDAVHAAAVFSGKAR